MLNLESFTVKATRVAFNDSQKCTVFDACKEDAHFELTVPFKGPGRLKTITYHACRAHIFNVLMEGHRSTNC